MEVMTPVVRSRVRVAGDNKSVLSGRVRMARVEVKTILDMLGLFERQKHSTERYA